MKIRAGSELTFYVIRMFKRNTVLASLLALLVLPCLAQAQQIEPCPANPPGNQIISRVPSTAPVPTPRITETLIDAGIPDDPAMLKLLEPYRAKVAELDTIIGRLQGELRKGPVGAGALGNFVTDGLRAEASRRLKKPVLLTISNSGGMRKSSIGEGDLRVRDIFELLPFENALIQIDLTGAQLLKLLAGVVSRGDAQSGARITYRLRDNNIPEMLIAKLLDERGKEMTINPKETYRIVTIDYLYGLGSGNYAILREGKNIKPIGTSLRDALLSYVRSETARGRPIRANLDGRFVQTGPAPSQQATPK